MNKFSFYSMLILSGTIGLVGILNAAVNKVEPGSSSEISGCLRGTDWIFFYGFLFLLCVGLIQSLVGVKKD